MEFANKTIEELEARKLAIASEMDTEGADLDALTDEVRRINAEMETRKAAEAKKAEIRKAVAAGKGQVVESAPKTERKTNEEIRSSEAYINAFANYIKTGNDKECRSLLTENVSGQLPVPTFLDNIIRTAWEKDDILSRVRRTGIRGNLRVPFELSASDAYVHTEGTTAVTEESLTFGVVTMTPANIKKWIKISDEAVAMGGETFLRYIYDELTYKIIKKLASLVIADVTGSPTSSDADEVGVSQVTLAPSVTTIPTAVANLSDEASDVVVIMNRLTEVEFISAYAAGNFAVDPFAGLRKVYTSALPAYSAAVAGSGIYAIVGDLRGCQVNFPEGDDVIIKWDDLSLAESDLVKVVGRIYAAHDVTGPGMLVNIVKPSAVTT